MTDSSMVAAVPSYCVGGHMRECKKGVRSRRPSLLGTSTDRGDVNGCKVGLMFLRLRKP